MTKDKKRGMDGTLADLDSISRVATGRRLSDNIARLVEFLGRPVRESVNLDDEDTRDCELLGVSPNASERVTKLVYRGFCWDNHPDRFQNEEQKKIAEAKFKEGQAAYRRICERREWKP